MTDTALSESRLRGLAEAVGYQTGWWCEKCHAFVDGIQVTYEEIHETCGYPVIPKTEKDLEETWDGAGFILGEMGKQSAITQQAFSNILLTQNFSQGILENRLFALTLCNLTPARIAQAAADALEVKE
jgi:hypothetical protein